MKKIWKIIGGAALAAGLIPYSVHTNDESDKTTIHALLWNSSVEPDPDKPGKRKITINFGFHKPIDPEAHLYEDDASWCGSAPVEEADEPTLDPNDVIRF